MNFLQLQDLTLTWLDDVNAGYFTRPQVKRFINNALREVQKELIQSGEGWYLRCQQTNTIAQKEAYSLPADFLRNHRLKVYTQGNGSNPSTDVSSVIMPATPVQITSLPAGPGTPSLYYIKKDCLVLRSVPDRAYPMQMLYSYAVSEMVSDTEVPDVPVQYQEYLSVLATIDGFMKDQRDASQFLTGKKESYKALMKQDADQRNVDFPRSIVSTENDGYEVFF